jgi:hypothetical protein
MPGAPTGQARQTSRPVGTLAGGRPVHRTAQPACSAVSLRLGPHVLLAGNLDARSRLDLLAESRALEEEDATGPLYFGLRIRQEPFPKGFLLPWDTPSTTVPPSQRTDW